MSNGVSAQESFNFRRKGVSARPDADIYSGVPTVEYDDGRDEKPWQRVPCAGLLVLLGLYLLLGYLTQLLEDEMPAVVSDASVARDNWNTFSEEKTWKYLETIVGEEPRVAGTRYHLQKTIELKALVDQVARDANLPVHTDWQMVSGDYWLNFATPYVNAYQNVSNIIAVLEGEAGFHPDGTTNTSLLLNCHYDSVPYALGMSDNAIFCGVMVEVLSRLSRRTQKFKHNVIFLFNGAEENPLMGSHAFLYHRWSKGVTNVVNMDAAGMNGKPFVFQVTDPRVLAAYNRAVRRPAGQSVGEFLFASGVIPSDTDFRIFRDFGNFHGIDIAFVKWGHVYHTRYDHPALVHPGVIQNAGDMLLSLVTELADDEELETQLEPVAAVYYDFLYWFMVSYSYGAALAADLLVALLGLLSVAYFVWLVGPRMTTVTELLYCAVGRLASMLGGILVCAVTTPIMVATTGQMRYLSEPWLVVPLYWVPYVVAAVCVSHAFDTWRSKKSGLNRSIRSLQAMSATRLLVSAMLLLITCIPALSTVRYLLTVPLFLMSVTSLVSITVVRYFRMQAWMLVMLEVLLSLPCVLYTLSLSVRFCALLVPLAGRSHGSLPDYTIAIVNVGLAVLVSSTVSGMELLFSRKRLWVVAGPAAAVCAVLMFIPFSPYRDDGPATQRHYWFNSEIISYDFNNRETYRQSGVLVTKYDPYTLDYVLPAAREHGILLESRTDFSRDCEEYVLCNLPLFRVRFGDYLNQVLWLYTGPPAPFPSSLAATRSCVGETCVLTFNMTGPAHNMVTLWPRDNVTVSSWSLSSRAAPSWSHRARPVYVIHHSTPTYSDVFQPFVFNVTFIVPLSLTSGPIVDVSHHAHLIHHPEHYTAEYRALLQAMPRYFNIASYMTFRKNYVF